MSKKTPESPLQIRNKHLPNPTSTIHARPRRPRPRIPVGPDARDGPGRRVRGLGSGLVCVSFFFGLTWLLVDSLRFVKFGKYGRRRSTWFLRWKDWVERVEGSWRSSKYRQNWCGDQLFTDMSLGGSVLIQFGFDVAAW